MPRRVRGRERHLAGPFVGGGAAVFCAVIWFLHDLQADREASTERPAAVQSGVKVADQVMKGYGAGEVSEQKEPVPGTLKTPAVSPLSAPPAGDQLPVVPGIPPKVNELGPPQSEQQARAAQLPSVPQTEVTRVETTQALDKKRLERLEAAFEAPTRVEVRREKDTRAPGRTADDRLADLRASLSQSGASYLDKLRQVREAGALGGSQGATNVRPALDPEVAYARFAGGGGDRWQLGHEMQHAAVYQLHAGSVIPATLQTPIHSQLPGPIAAIVAQDVRDSTTGRHILIPQGSRLLGTYDADVGHGQERLLVAWQRLTWPDGRTLDLGAMPGSDGAGHVGLQDQVDTHFWQQLRSAVLMSGVTAGVGLSQTQLANQPNESTVGSVMAQSLGQQLGQLTEEMLRRQMNVAPTLEIRPGYRLNVAVTKDLVFDAPYTGNSAWR